MQRQTYEFRLRSSLFVLLMGYFGAIATVVSAGVMISLALKARAPATYLLCGGAALLLLLCLFVLRRVLVQVAELNVGKAGAYFRRLRGRRFVAWKEVVQLRGDGRVVRLVYRDGASLDEVWAPCPDRQVVSRIETFAAHQMDLARQQPPPAAPTTGA